MQYYEQDDRRRRVWGIIGVVLYLAVCAGVMFITHTISLPEPEMGILVDFGTSDAGMGEDDLAAGEVDTRPATPLSQTAAEPVMTTEDPEAPEVVPETRPETTPAAPVPEPAPARQPDRRALFPGRTEGSDATSQGTAGGEGNQGTQEGSPGGSDSAGGSGSSVFSLAGRRDVGNWPLPIYNIAEEGRVVIRIVVNAQGVVTNAYFQQGGSTTNVSGLVNAARAAALKARFTTSEQDVQEGTITYIFKQKSE